MLENNNFTANYQNILNVKNFIDNGVSVEIVNIAKLVFGKNASQETLCEGGAIMSIDNFTEFGKFLSKNKDALFYFGGNKEMKYFRIFWFFNRYKIDLFTFRQNFLPQIQYPKNSFENMFKSILKRFKDRGIFENLKRILRRFLYAILQYFIDIKYHTFFIDGDIALLGVKQEDAKQIVRINANDVELYNQIKSKQKDANIPNGDFILFLDQFLPYHPDLMTIPKQNRPNNKTKGIYFKQINALFNNLEAKYCMPVVIAAHPVSSYKNDEFNGRLILKGISNELVVSCFGVVTHYSTSISFAVLANKPIIFLDNEMINNITKIQNPQIVKRMADAVGGCYINLESSEIVAEFKEIDLTKYNRYKYDYLTSKDSENLNNKEIIAKWLKSIA
ncbi:hypothetical protein CDQ67_09685 [Campylobacter hyointestinalis subsp. hyointestinalis]|nr:hypothetical protein CDQ67_09685 [Campylobacter hyointestinalis subsp. hyointestinalis]